MTLNIIMNTEHCEKSKIVAYKVIHIQLKQKIKEKKCMLIAKNLQS